MHLRRPALPATPALVHVAALRHVAALLAGVALLAGACTLTAAAPTTTPAPTTTAAPTTAAAPTATAAPAVADSLIVEPDAGTAPLYALLSSPQHRLDLVVYELVDPEALAILEADAARGVMVRVILDQNRERRANTPSYDRLSAHGVGVVWASPSFEATHEKAVVIDAGWPTAALVILTLNLTVRYYTDTRDVAVVDLDPADVASAESNFDTDLAAAEGNPEGEVEGRRGGTIGGDLVWSPGARPSLVELIAAARRTLSVEAEEMSDSAIVEALGAAAQRGVAVTVVMTDQSRYRPELAALRSAGVDLRLLPDRSSVLYIHAKVIVADGTRAFVGSENFSTASLDHDRELGLIVSAAIPVAALVAMVDTDARNPAAVDG